MQASNIACNASNSSIDGIIAYNCDEVIVQTIFAIHQEVLVENVIVSTNFDVGSIICSYPYIC